MKEDMCNEAEMVERVINIGVQARGRGCGMYIFAICTALDQYLMDTLLVLTIFLLSVVWN